MDKLAIYCLRLISSFILLLIIGCNAMDSSRTQVPTVTPSFLYSPTPVPQFFHYSTASGSDIYIEFDYPSSWGMGDDLQESRLNITLYDPRYFTLPTPSPGDNHPIANDFGYINIRIRPIQSDESFQQLVDEFANAGVSFRVDLRNYQRKMANQDSFVFEYLITENNPDIYTSEMFGRKIFFEVNHFIYSITFMIAEKDRENEFEQGYEYFLDSIKVVR